MANKLKIPIKYDLDEYEASGSDDDYVEEEKKLLDKVRKNNQRPYDSEEEVLGFDEGAGSEDDNLVGDSDIEGADEYNDGDIPDSKAWGKKRGAYYNTDFVDQDYSTYNEQEEDLAQQEEEEAKAIQLRLAKQLNDTDYLDIFTEHMTVPTREETSKVAAAETDTTFNADLTDLSQRQKQQLFNSSAPEFKGLIEGFEHFLKESNSMLMPFLEFANSKNINHPIVDFVKLRNNIISKYCATIIFYITLKAKRQSIKSHPVIKRLFQTHQLLKQLEERYKNFVEPQIEEILESIRNGVDVQLTMETIVKQPVPITKKKKMKFIQSLIPETTADDLNGIVSGNDEDENMSDDIDKIDDKSDTNDVSAANSDVDGDDSRRAITYQIAKNKGLTPHRKKENRNPRVKHRNKYRKALIRRKGAVRTVRKEINRYAGEMSGIKIGVKKGIQFKS